MKLLFLNTNIGYGGASKQMVWVANLCASLGHDVTFLTYRESTECQRLSELINRKHVQLETKDGGSNGLLRTIKYLHHYIKEEQFDVAIGFLSPSQLRLSFATIGTLTRLLFSYRGDPYEHLSGIKAGVLEAINAFAFRRADWFVFQTEMARDAFSKAARERSAVIPNPIAPLQRTKERSKGIQHRIVCVGRLDIHQKRQDLLINAFMNISQRYPDYTLDLYGDGPDEERLKGLAANCEQIRFMGKTTNVAEAIQQASMFVLSSDYEGIPNALLEAMSIGVPCISTDCSPGGARLLIRSNEEGILVPKGDVSALSEAMSWYIDNPEQRERIGINGREVNHRFAEDRIGREWIKVINKLQK